jgi:hypothetical protein
VNTQNDNEFSILWLPYFQCCGFGSGVFFTPGPRSGIRIGFFPDPRSQHIYFLELCDKCLGKKFYNSLKTGSNFFSILKNEIILGNLWLQDPGWVKIRIRDKHPGSAKLHVSKAFS